MKSETISHYRIREQLGAGGMGVVYRAEDTRLGRQVAIKFLPEAARQDRETLARFQREARAASSLNHPNICTLHDIGEHEGRPFLVMELLKGQTLGRRLGSGRLPLDRLLDVSMQVADALDAAHAQGIVHRDIKPANLFLTDRELVKVLDFGIAKLSLPGSAGLEAHLASLGSENATLTREGTLVGTLAYMSPEQARGDPVDARTDIFALGAVLYEMATGSPAFSGSSPATLLDAILNRTPLSATRLNPGLPDALERVIEKALEKDPRLRYQHASELRTDLARIRRDADALRQRPAQLGAGQAGAAEPAQSGGVARERSGRLSRAWLGLLAALVLLTVLAIVVRSTMVQRGAHLDSIAVLPFSNATGDAGMEYLSDGLTVSLINNLTDLGQLRVKSRGAAFRYKGRADDPQAAGRDLGVSGVVTGAVRRRGDHLVVVADLVETDTGNQAWGAQFSRPASDLFALEDEIARSIAEKLTLRLTPAKERRLSKRYTENIEAYHLYLQGSFHAGTFREEGLRRAIQYYRRALDLDPRYALAYTGLAHAYFWFTDWYAPSKEVSPLAIDAARSALQIDERLAQAHGMLALVTLIYEWDWPQAEREFLRALELDPADARTRAYYAWLLVITGRVERAIAEARRAQESESLSAENYTIAGLVLSLARQYEQAVAAEQRAIELDPSFTWAYIILGRTLQAQGRVSEALPRLEQARALEPRLPEALATLGNAQAVAGRGDAARATLLELKELASQRHVAPFDIATVYVGLGEHDLALDWLEKAHVERSYLMPSLAALQAFDELRSEPRFQALLRRMNLPAAPTGALR